MPTSIFALFWATMKRMRKSHNYVRMSTLKSTLIASWGNQRGPSVSSKREKKECMRSSHRTGRRHFSSDFWWAFDEIVFNASILTKAVDRGSIFLAVLLLGCSIHMSLNCIAQNRLQKKFLEIRHKCWTCVTLGLKWTNRFMEVRGDCDHTCHVFFFFCPWPSFNIRASKSQTCNSKGKRL